MLSLTRKRNEQIVLTLPDGRRVIVTIADIARDRVRIAVDAPRDVLILRGELEDPNRDLGGES